MSRAVTSSEVGATASTPYTLGRSATFGRVEPCAAGPVWANYHNGKRSVTNVVRCNRPAGHTGRHAFSSADRYGLAEWGDADVVA